MNLADWLDRESIAARLTACGMSAECTANAAACFEQAARSLQNIGGARPTAAVVSCWAPGRIEVLGKHTDYCGGSSILAAVERGFCMVALPRDDGRVTIVDPEYPFRERVLDKNTEPVLGHWSNYPHTVVRRFAKNFPNACRGATIAFASNLPPSSGMSSSSAFVVGTFLLLSRINDLQHDPTYANTIRTPEDLAGYLGTVENGASFGPLAGDCGVGTFGGSEDHTAILCAQPNRIVEFAYCPVRFRRSIDLSDDFVFAIASSGVVAEKTGAALDKYNRVSLLARVIVEEWRGSRGGEPTSLAAIIASAPDAASELRRLLASAANSQFAPSELIQRLDHFLVESQLIAAAPSSIDAATIDQFGQLVAKSQDAGARLLHNQTAETLRLVELATKLGARATSAFGAGFGGSAGALVDRSQATDLLTGWKSQYQAEFPELERQAMFFLTQPGVAAITID
jgi:galactokinase